MKKSYEKVKRKVSNRERFAGVYFFAPNAAAMLAQHKCEKIQER